MRIINKILNHPMFIILSIVSVVLAFFSDIESFFFAKIYYCTGDELLAKEYATLIQYILIAVFMFLAFFKILKWLCKLCIKYILNLNWWINLLLMNWDY